MSLGPQNSEKCVHEDKTVWILMEFQDQDSNRVGRSHCLTDQDFLGCGSWLGRALSPEDLLERRIRGP